MGVLCAETAEFASFIACPEPCHPRAHRGVGKGPRGCTRAQPGSMGMTAVKMMVCDQEISTALAQNWGRVKETTRNAGRDENTCWPRELKRQEGVKQKGQGEKQASA